MHIIYFLLQQCIVKSRSRRNRYLPKASEKFERVRLEFAAIRILSQRSFDARYRLCELREISRRVISAERERAVREEIEIISQALLVLGNVCVRLRSPRAV